MDMSEESDTRVTFDSLAKSMLWSKQILTHCIKVFSAPI